MAYASTVGVDTLRCTCCKEWKPDAAFCSHTTYKHRRGRNYRCRDCVAAIHRRKPRYGKYDGPFVSIYAPWSHPLPTTPLEPGPLTRGDR